MHTDSWLAGQVWRKGDAIKSLLRKSARITFTKTINTVPLDLETETPLLSILKADPQRVDLHLSYSPGLERGPIIQRRGDRPPIMEDPEKHGSYNTDPELQRLGSFYILEQHKEKHVPELYLRFAANYILFGALDQNAHSEAERVFLDVFPSASGFPAPPRLVLEELSSRVVDFRQTLEATLLGTKLQKLFDNWPTTDPAQHATSTMRSLYGKTYPDYVARFAEYSQQDRFKRTIRNNTAKYLRLLLQSAQTPSHEGTAVNRLESRSDIVLMQGCGDLTMNEWNVAFVAGASHRRGRPEDWHLLHASSEPLNDRTYTCLIKWACERTDPELQDAARATRIVYPYQIASLKFLGPIHQSSA